MLQGPSEIAGISFHRVVSQVTVIHDLALSTVIPANIRPQQKMYVSGLSYRLYKSAWRPP
jgi:hypothetical protein